MGVEAEGRRALRVIVVLILNEVLLGMVILVHPCLSGIEVRGRNPLDSAVCAFPRCPAALFDEAVVRAAGQGELVDIGGTVRGGPAVDVVSLTPIAGRGASWPGAATGAGVTV